MKPSLEETIAAISTPPGVGGIAVVRISGKEAIALAERFFRPSHNGRLVEKPSHTIHHGHFVDEEEKVLDEVLVSLFRSPHSYTGEEVVEISCHGGLHLTRRILEVLVRQGARFAEPGEFTKRAFLNGKIDLTQAEAVLDLIRAQSDRSLELALSQLRGSLSRKIQGLKEKLLKVQAHLEASLDFPEEHLEVMSQAASLQELTEIEKEMEALLASFRRGSLLREGILTVIVGRPNVGKSSLLNALLARDRALVSPIPGTTRDALEESIEIAGIAIRLVDTAGLGLSAASELDRLGMERTQAYLEEAALLLFVVDGSEPWTREDEMLFDKIQRKNFLLAVNKIDLPQKFNSTALKNTPSFEKNSVLISCLTGKGLSELEKAIERNILELTGSEASTTLMRLRHRQAFEEALAALRRAKEGIQRDLSAELLLVDLKQTLDAFRELVGEIYSEDLLDVIFQEFCIGK